MKEKRPDIPIVNMHHGLEGEFLHASDRENLLAAASEGKTFFTCALETIPSRLRCEEEGLRNGGIVTVHRRSISASDCEGWTKALIQLWEEEGSQDGSQRVYFLRPADAL
jgi:hypothetical protein